jgi:hypothetical protein
MPITINDCIHCPKPHIRLVPIDRDKIGIECACGSALTVRGSTRLLVEKWNELNPMEVKDADNDK